MLVLSRKAGERIWIGENISVTVVRITGGGVRIGIEAPVEMAVVREELKLRMSQSEDQKSSEPISDGSLKHPETIRQPAWVIVRYYACNVSVGLEIENDTLGNWCLCLLGFARFRLSTPESTSKLTALYALILTRMKSTNEGDVSVTKPIDNLFVSNKVDLNLADLSQLKSTEKIDAFCN